MTINLIFLIIIAFFSLFSLILLIFLLKNKKNNNIPKNNGDFFSELLSLRKELKNNFDSQATLFKTLNELQSNNTKNFADSSLKSLELSSNTQRDNLKEIQLKLEKILESNEIKLSKTNDILQMGLTKLQQDNEKKLEQMRQTVDEKLHESLEKRLAESFTVISKRLEDVYRGLGEMQNLAIGVGDLKKVLTNVKTRGVWGEISLGNILEQMLSQNQFEKNVAVKTEGQERVDFVIKIPGKDDSIVFLPIDSKFPIEAYQRLCEASENGSILDVEKAGKELELQVKKEAKSIHDKYINVPKTTDFAILYLPIEGLYAEVVKRVGLIDNLQTTYRVNVCGPSTISSLINTLQMGFRTLAIEKRSSEIWTLLGIIKQEFEKFTDLLAKTKKKLAEASGAIELATKKSETMARKLKSVATLEGEENSVLIFEGDESPVDDK